MVLILKTILIATLVTVGTAQNFRGVQKDLQQKFASFGTTFRCFDGSGEFPIAFVNDEFCDCTDGSDEPGSAACSLQTRNNPTWRFQCTDTSFVTKEILHSFVNDGICDCCDGSDEYNFPQACKNTCAEVFEKAEKERELREAVRQAGLKAREALVEKAASLRGELRVKLVDEQTKLKLLETELSEAEAEEIRATASEAAERKKIKEKSENDHEVWKLAQEAKKREAEEAKKLNPEPEANNQIICSKWRQTSDCSATGERQPSEDKECDAVIQDGLSGFCDCVDSETGSEIRFDFDCGHKPLRCSFVCSHNGSEPESIEDPKEEVFVVDDGSKFELPEATSARQLVGEKKRLRDDTNNRIRDIESDLSRDFGPDDALLPLKGQCFELEQRDYTYKFCPFNEIVQQRKGTGHGPIMGRFKSFGEQSYSSWGAKQDFTHMKFTDGEQCWGGPQRSTDVHLVCGSDSELVSVEEPSMCTYKMVFHTPAVCE